MTQEELKLVLDALKFCHGGEPCGTAEAIAVVEKALALPQRTWVGLTNNDLQPIAEEYRILFGSWVHDFARAIEAKLKEKNT